MFSKLFYTKLSPICHAGIMRWDWNWRQFIPVTTVISAVVFIVSGLIARHVAMIKNVDTTDANNYSSAILLVIFITIPAFCVMVFGIVALSIDSINRRRQ